MARAWPPGHARRSNAFAARPATRCGGVPARLSRPGREGPPPISRAPREESPEARCAAPFLQTRFCGCEAPVQRTGCRKKTDCGVDRSDGLELTPRLRDCGRGGENSACSGADEAAEALGLGGDRALARPRPGSPARWASSASSRSQPSARACGQQASTSVARRPEAGTQRSRCGSSSCARMPSRAARKRFSSSTSGAWESSGSAMPSQRLEPHEALDQRDQRGGVADAGLRVHHAHLERAELGLQAHVPPDERRLGDRAAADQDVDRLGVVGVGARTRAGCRCAGTPGRRACGRWPARSPARG